MAVTNSLSAAAMYPAKNPKADLKRDNANVADAEAEVERTRREARTLALVTQLVAEKRV